MLLESFGRAGGVHSGHSLCSGCLLYMYAGVIMTRYTAMFGAPCFTTVSHYSFGTVVKGAIEAQQHSVVRTCIFEVFIAQ